MALHGDKEAIGILGIDEDVGDLLGVAQSEVRPVLASIGGLVHAVAGGQIWPLQAFPTADVNYVGIGRRNSDRAHRTGALVVKNGFPGVASIGGLPDAAIHRSHVKNIRLMRYAEDRHGAAAPKRTDAAPAHLGEKPGVVLLRRAGHSQTENRDHSQSATRKTPVPHAVHAPPPKM